MEGVIAIQCSDVVVYIVCNILDKLGCEVWYVCSRHRMDIDSLALLMLALPFSPSVAVGDVPSIGCLQITHESSLISIAKKLEIKVQKIEGAADWKLAHGMKLEHMVLRSWLVSHAHSL